MKIQIASDLHLEFSGNRKWMEENPLIPAGDVLLLAGDIVSDKHKKKAKQFYSFIDSNFEKVISTMGNHEFYYGEIDYAYPGYQSQISTCHLKLNNKTIIFNNVKFIVSTLWSYIPEHYFDEIYNLINDYRMIYRKEHSEKINILIEQTNKYHNLSLNFIKSELKKDFDGKIIIMTHHLPSFLCIPEKYRHNIINCAYATELDDLISANHIDYWVFGHIHESIDISIGNTKLISNPLGYMDENHKYIFDRKLVFEV